MRYSTILFDFDYTLADSSRGILTCFRNVLERHGYTNVTDNAIKRTIGKTLDDSFSILTGITNREELAALRKEYSKEADTHMTVNTFLFPDVKPTLEELKEKGMQLGIISTKYRYRIIEFLDLHFAPEWFDIIIGGEDVVNHKPDPEGLIMAIEKLNTTKGKTLYVGDSLVDAETAARAGVDFMGVTTGTTTKEEFTAFPAVGIVGGIEEIE